MLSYLGRHIARKWRRFLKINNDIGFLHVPKTGGQSIERSILASMHSKPEESLLRKNGNSNLGPPRLAHLFYKEYVDIYKYSPKKWFALVRNPLDRFLSEARFRGCRQDEVSVLANKVVFNFLEDDFLTFEDEKRHVVPQYKYFEGSKNLVLMRFEDFFDSPVLHIASLGIKLPDESFPHVIPKATRKNQERVVLDGITADKITDYYSKDFEIYNSVSKGQWTEIQV